MYTIRRRLARMAFLSLSLLLVLATGCAPTAHIKPMRLSPWTWRIVELANGTVPLMFSFQAGQDCARARLWVEYYRDGERVESGVEPLYIDRPEGKPLSGAIAAQDGISPDWVLRIRPSLGAAQSATYDTLGLVAGTGVFAKLEKTLPIRPNQEIVLYALLLNESNTSPAKIEDLQSLAAPEAIKGKSDVACVIKCTFGDA